MANRRALAAALVAVTGMLAVAHATSFGQPAGGPATAAQELPQKARVLVKDNYFEPRSAEIVEGGLVVWKWRGENRHNVRFTKVPKGAARKGAKLRSRGPVEAQVPKARRVSLRLPAVGRHARLGDGAPEPEPPTTRPRTAQALITARQPERVLGDVVEDHLA